MTPKGKRGRRSSLELVASRSRCDGKEETNVWVDDGDEIRRALHDGALDDQRFDSLYPPEIRDVSQRFWTPIVVARRSSELFEKCGARRIFDVGSGVGKFCIIAAMGGHGFTIYGTEQRPHLVEIARRVSIRCGTSDIRFARGDATASPWSGYDGLYFFNPFGENLFVDDDHLDATVELSLRKYVSSAARTTNALANAAMGTVVVSYHCLGAPIPRSYELTHAEKICTGWLRVWAKKREADRGSPHWIETDDGSFGEAKVFDLGPGRTA